MSTELVKQGNEDLTDEDFEKMVEDSRVAGVPVPVLHVGLAVVDVRSATLVVAEIQFLRKTAANLRAQAELVAARQERMAEWLLTRHRGGLEAVLDAETVGKKVKSVKLMSGMGPEPAVMGRRTTPGGLRVVDADAAIAWAKAEGMNDGGEFVNVSVTEKPVAAVFRVWYETTGELPAGCIVQEDETRFYVK